MGEILTERFLTMLQAMGRLNLPASRRQCIGRRLGVEPGASVLRRARFQ